MESYLKNILGLHVDVNMWDDSKTLPDELKNGKEFWIVVIAGIQCLVIKEDSTDFQISLHLKEQESFNNYCKYPKVLLFDRITSYQRKCLIENRISFIVPDNQLYMPFLGIALQEHFKAQTVAGTQLTANAQYILLSAIYDKSGAYKSKLDISKELDISLMNVSRGVQELEELHLIETRKRGRSSMVISDVSGKDLLLKAQDYMRDPVQKRFYAKSQDWLLELPVAGAQACEQLQFWKNEDELATHRTRAIEKKVYLEHMDKIEQVDPAWDRHVDYIELEVWRYDPARFTDGKIVDSISLALSMGGCDDDKMKVNIDKLLD